MTVHRSGTERRHGSGDRRAGGGLDDNTIHMLRMVVREEIREAAKDGRFLTDEDRAGVRAMLAEQRARAARLEKLRGHVVGWAVIAALGWVSWAVWEAVKVRIHQP